MGNSRDPFQEGKYYHIVNKSFANMILRETSNDYKTFILQIIDHLMSYPDIKLFSYCILPDHFHLIIHNIKKGFDISNFMKKIQISYAMYFKKNHKDMASTKGLPVFRGRFKAREIESENLDKLISYVNYNPLHHEIVESISNRPYSSVHQLADTGYDYTQETYIKINNSDSEINVYPSSEIILEFEID